MKLSLPLESVIVWTPTSKVHVWCKAGFHDVIKCGELLGRWFDFRLGVVMTELKIPGEEII